MKKVKFWEVKKIKRWEVKIGKCWEVITKRGIKLCSVPVAFDPNFHVNIYVAARAACTAMQNLVSNIAFGLSPRKTTENLVEIIGCVTVMIQTDF
jgi:hypothetical protein